MTIRVAVAILLIAAIGVWLWEARHRADSDATPGATASTEGDSAGLPTRGSEDVSHILGLATRQGAVAKRRGPDETTEWVIELVFPADRVPEKGDLWRAFGSGWTRHTEGRSVYAYDGQREQWAELRFASVGVGLPRAAVVLTFLEESIDDPMGQPIPESRFASLLERVREGARKLDAEVLPSLSPAEAAQRSRSLADLRHSDYDVELVLQAPPGTEYQGKEVWDVMLCLGMRWDEMHLTQWFYVPNPSETRFVSGLFRVWTKTQPTYFSPKAIASGTVRVEDLRFRFSVPCAADPPRVLTQIRSAINYARKRLGGTITAADGSPFKMEEELRKVKAIVDRFMALGFSPGDPSTLRLF